MQYQEIPNITNINIENENDIKRIKKTKIYKKIKKLVVNFQLEINSIISRYETISFLIGYYGKITTTIW